MDNDFEVEKIEFGTIPQFSGPERYSLIDDMLREHVCNVKFTKVNGDVREMKCTLREDVLNQEESSKQINTARKDPQLSPVIAAFLPEVKEWRSFRVSNVISIEIVSEN